ncbi:hypothetical protein METBIDRAFT_117039 [Metschnikowia bicuspidata var. bicuspidata NRRL YB-4993]|uniref:Uncharacterized protein n=1 Tax=Metschnikowia bicuspidata var. bicuspidata NRRL YB-4993 TaxID=869754 RepID=A0A1A0HIT5_9ASCO|nr:hypothetical protein METBIDRAFT_117039 [Metschnikowia bicuspidata var. bicuspidata NRRL YB-4993]OBA24069.1 hypothetical protein METBIDRAFT_117039 [Metschnikowia bicuspidata var. bicuspidata NRRL YB-4993]
MTFTCLGNKWPDVKCISALQPERWKPWSETRTMTAETKCMCGIFQDINNEHSERFLDCSNLSHFVQLSPESIRAPIGKASTPNHLSICNHKLLQQDLGPGPHCSLAPHRRTAANSCSALKTRSGLSNHIKSKKEQWIQTRSEIVATRPAAKHHPTLAES